MELKTLRDWIYDVLRVRAERHWPLRRHPRVRDARVRKQSTH